MSAITKVLFPYVLGFSLTAFLLPQDKFIRIAYQYYHLQGLWMQGERLYLAEIPSQKKETQ